MYSLFRKKQFKKDYKRVSRNPEFNPHALEYVLHCLIRGEALESRYRVHGLGGEYAGYFECHLQPDILLIYTLDEETETVYLLRIGSHSELF